MNKFSDHYYNEDEVLNEGLFTALVGKLGTSFANMFRARKGINIAADFLRIFQPMKRPKYEKALSVLSDLYLQHNVKKGISVKDIRFGSVTGKFFGNMFS